MIITTINETFKARDKFWLGTIIVLSTLIVFYPVTENGFIFYDDAVSIWDNPNVFTGLSFENLKWAITSKHHANWFPLTWLWHQLDCQVYGLMPGAHHVTSLYLHLVNATLLFVLLKALTKQTSASFWVALIFAIHPLRVEVVAWASEKKEILCLFFTLISLLFYSEYKKKGKRSWLGLSVLGFFVSIMAKPMSISLPVLITLLEFWPLKSFELKGVSFFGFIVQFMKQAFAVEKWPFWVISFFSGVMTVWSQGSGGAINSLSVVPISVRILNACNSYLVYLFDFFWPRNLFFLYPLELEDLGIKGALAFFVLLILTFLSFSKLKHKPFLAFGWCWYMVALTPVIGIISVGTLARADRYTYLPGIGLTIAVIWFLFATFPKKSHILNLGLILFCLFLGKTSFDQVKTWKTNRTLLEHALSVKENNFEVLLFLADVEMKDGNSERAVSLLRRASIIRQSSHLFFLLGTSYLYLNENGEAKVAFQEAIRLDSYEVYSYVSRVKLAEILEVEGKIEQAKVNYLICIAKQPFFKYAQLKLAKLYCEQGDFEAAQDILVPCLEITYNPVELRGDLDIDLWEKEIGFLLEYLENKRPYKAEKG